MCRGKIIFGVLLVKSAIWVISLGSGTSGEVLAPLLMMGAALGGVEAQFFPQLGAGFWPLVSMGAILGGTMRSPFTGVLFALELTHDFNMALALLVACFLGHAFTVLTLKRSILTEKIARRGYHLSREYAFDPLEILFVREVMQTNLVAFSADSSLEELRNLIDPSHPQRGQLLYPLVDDARRVLGVISRNQISKILEAKATNPGLPTLRDLVIQNPVVAYPDEPLRVVVNRMAETGFTRLPVVDRSDERSCRA